MKFEVTRFKTLRLALNEIAQYVRDPEHLQTGKPVEKFGGLRPRELLANWLICAAFNEYNGTPERVTFIADGKGTDETFGDGILYDTEPKETFPTEHVMVPIPREENVPDIEARILKAINDKNNKGGGGPTYARGKTLVVFLNDGRGLQWSPNKVAKALPNPFHFPVAWVVGLHTYNAETGEYAYFASMLQLVDGNAPTFVIRTTDFDSWTVTRIP
jgi:hypothetical protein